MNIIFLGAPTLFYIFLGPVFTGKICEFGGGPPKLCVGLAREVRQASAVKQAREQHSCPPRIQLWSPIAHGHGNSLLGFVSSVAMAILTNRTVVVEDAALAGRFIGLGGAVHAHFFSREGWWGGPIECAALANRIRVPSASLPALRAFPGRAWG